MMDNVTSRIDRAVKIGGFRSRRSMCESIGIPYGTLNNWIKRDNLPASGILALTDALKISKYYLETGEGEAEIKETPSLQDLSEEELIALLPKDQQQLVQSYRKLPEDKKRENREKILLEAAEAEISQGGL